MPSGGWVCFLSFPATVTNVVSTSLQLNALERKPRASCCLTSAAKCKLEIKKKGKRAGGSGKLLWVGQGRQPPRGNPAHLFLEMLQQGHILSCFSNQSGSRK